MSKVGDTEVMHRSKSKPPIMMNNAPELLIKRFMQHDPSFWQEIDNPPLGWLDSVEFIDEHACKLMQWAKLLVAEHQVKHMFLIGMGGSSLAAGVFYSVFGKQEGFPDLTLLDTTSPATLQRLEIDDQAIFIVSSKSGTTIETRNLYAWLFEKAKSLQGPPNKRFIAITDSDTELVKIASTEKFLRLFITPKDIVGRFSALSYFSLVPAALLGIDLVRLGKQLNRSWSKCLVGKSPDLLNMVGALNACSVSGYGTLGIDLQTPLCSLFGWVEQLIAESLGKQGKGILPVNPKRIDSRILSSDKYQSISIGLLDSQNPHEMCGQKTNQTIITMQDEYDLGAIFMQWMAATSIVANCLNINAFDQPDVELSKRETLRFFENSQQQISNAERPDFRNVTLQCGSESANVSIGKIESFCKQAGEESYLAVLAYLPEERAVKKSLENLADAFLSQFDIVTIGFGPRYLHSTGQYHKGGPQIGCFLEIVEDHELEIQIPGREYGFSRLHRAQADGDFLVLRKKRRPVLRLLIQEERVKEIDQFTRLLNSMKSSM